MTQPSKTRPSRKPDCTGSHPRYAGHPLERYWCPGPNSETTQQQPKEVRRR